MKRLLPYLAPVSVIAATAQLSSAATVAVTWLQLEAGGTPASFNLENDAGTNLASGSISITNGNIFPGRPSGRTILNDTWTGAPPVGNATTGNATVTGFEVRVVPPSGGGAANYDITFSVPAGVALVVAVGELLRDGTSATAGVGLSFPGTTPPTMVSLLGTTGWTDGIRSYSDDLAWDGTTLTTVAGATGESKIAFLSIPALSGASPQIRLSIPSGYASGTGDTLFFAIGTVIPEPSGALLSGIGLATLLWRRPRRG